MLEPFKLTNDSIEVYKDQIGKMERAVTPMALAQMVGLMFLNQHEQFAAELVTLSRKIDQTREHFIISFPNSDMLSTFDVIADNMAKRGFWRAAGV
jgi:hypothetical protein